MLYFLEKKNQNILDLINRYLYSKYRFMSLYGEENFIEFGCMLARKLSISLHGSPERGEEPKKPVILCLSVVKKEKKKTFLLLNLFRSSPPFYQKLQIYGVGYIKRFFSLPFPCYREVRLVSELWSLKESALNLTFTRKRR